MTISTLTPLVQMVPLALTALADDDAAASLAEEVLTRMLTRPLERNEASCRIKDATAVALALRSP